jgi:hypothetical protein
MRKVENKMDFVSILESLLILAGLVEAVSEIVKAPYLTAKNAVLVYQGKPKENELSSYEKRVITVILSLAICIGAGFGIDIPAWSEPALLQYIIAGIFASLGSNILHMLLSIAIAVKDAIEKIKEAQNNTQV